MSKKKNNTSANKRFDGQHDGEEVLFVFRRHPVVMRKGLIYFMLALLFGMIPATIKPDNLNLLWFALVGLVVGAIIMWYYWLSWHFSVFIVTDMRLIQITQKGLFSRSVVDLGLDKIQTVSYQVAGLQETLLGFGTILLQTFVGDLVIEQVHKPAEIQERITHIIKELHIEPVAPASEES